MDLPRSTTIHQRVFSLQHLLLILMGVLWSIFWIPGVPTDLFLDLKDGLFLLFIGLSLTKLVLQERLAFNRLFETPASRLLLILLVATFWGVITSPTPVGSLVVWSRFFAAFLVYAILRYLFQNSPRFLATFPPLLVWSVLLSAIYVALAQLGLFEPFSPPIEFAIHNPAAAGFSFRELGLSYSIAFVMPLVFIQPLSRRSSPLSKLLWVGVVILLLAVSFLTEGRGGLLGAIVGMLVVMGTGSSGIRRMGLLIALFGVLVGVVLFGSLPLTDVLFNRVDLTYWRADDLTSRDWYDLTSGRNIQWLLAIDAIQRSPVFGVGLGNFGAAVLSAEGFKGTDLHNFFLGLAVEAGLVAAIVGLTFFLYVFISYGRLARRWQHKKSDYFVSALYAILIAYAVQLLFDIGAMFYSLYQGLPFWVALAALDVLSQQRVSQPSLCAINKRVLRDRINPYHRPVS